MGDSSDEDAVCRTCPGPPPYFCMDKAAPIIAIFFLLLPSPLVPSQIPPKYPPSQISPLLVHLLAFLPCARQFDPQDADFYKQRLGRAVFLLREHGKEPEEANKEKKLRKQERKRERAELDELEDRPRVSKAWEAAEVEQRSQGLPIKLPDGSIKKVMLPAYPLAPPRPSSCPDASVGRPGEQHTLPRHCYAPHATEKPPRNFHPSARFMACKGMVYGNSLGTLPRMQVKRDAPLAADVHPDDLPAPLTDR